MEETPSHRDALHARLPISGAGRFLTTGSGALGWGLPLAVGRALADGERVVCVVGDGSALYSVQALWTAARHRAPVTYLLLDNGGYGAVKALGRRIGITPVPGTEYRRHRLRRARRVLRLPGRPGGAARRPSQGPRPGPRPRP
ncbi:thiamine pyrophosphate-dependent enzyme [Streptomyces sp. PSAA01]|nr:thiamine pyrophosphate-dependent enzyme [Streptomyces sp. PSAA01]